MALTTLLLYKFETDSMPAWGVSYDGESLVALAATTMADSLKAATQLTGKGYESTADLSAALGAPVLALSTLSLLPPLDRSSRIFCVGKNYRDHAAEMAHMTGPAPAAPTAPDIFLRLASSFASGTGSVYYPKGEDSYDYEGELAYVVGSPAEALQANEAASCLAGIAPALDGSLRRLQKRTSQFTLGKNIDESGAFGPAIAITGNNTEPRRLSTHINGEQRQADMSDNVTFSIEHVLATISHLTRLEPGDIILSGTPAGVGAGFNPPRYLTDGDTVRVEVDGLPALTVCVRESTRPAL